MVEVGQRWLFKGKNKKNKFVIGITKIPDGKYNVKIIGLVILHFLEEDYEQPYIRQFSLYAYKNGRVGADKQNLPGGGTWIKLPNQNQIQRI